MLIKINNPKDVEDGGNEIYIYNQNDAPPIS
jgi:hypothetical protein